MLIRPPVVALTVYIHSKACAWIVSANISGFSKAFLEAQVSTPGAPPNMPSAKVSDIMPGIALDANSDQYWI